MAGVFPDTGVGSLREDGMRASYGVYTLCPFITVARKSSL
jgi:hypothetical protein